MSKKRKRHNPEEIVRKLRDAEAMLNAGKDLAAVLQGLEISEATYHRWRNQYGGMKSEEAKRHSESAIHFSIGSGEVKRRGICGGEGAGSFDKSAKGTA
jgi:hypothetical protein